MRDPFRFFSRSKYFVIPERVVEAGNHHIWEHVPGKISNLQIFTKIKTRPFIPMRSFSGRGRIVQMSRSGSSLGGHTVIVTRQVEIAISPLLSAVSYETGLIWFSLLRGDTRRYHVILMAECLFGAQILKKKEEESTCCNRNIIQRKQNGLLNVFV